MEQKNISRKEKRKRRRVWAGRNPGRCENLSEFEIGGANRDFTSGFVVPAMGRESTFVAVCAVCAV
jgi:hypothetical protein